jgi:uncharacterized protein (TIGR02271 family)
MTKTVVGIFDSMAEAQRIKRDLVNDGYPAESVQVMADEESPVSSTGQSSSEARSGSEHTGVMSSIKRFFSSFTEAGDEDRDYYSSGVSRGGAIVAVTVPDERVRAVEGKLKQYGALDIDEENAGTVGTSTGLAETAGTDAGIAAANTDSGVVGRAPRSSSTAADANEDLAIPVVKEELLVGKRQVNRGGVRVYSHVVETPVEENVQLREERVQVQRTPVDRAATEADFQGAREGGIELTESAEEAVVSKQARVVEEVKVGKDVSERTETIRDTVRRTEVEVEDLPGDNATKATTSGT